MLEIEGLSKTYGNGVQALRNVTLTAGPGIFGLLGPNGAGKSSLMRTLATLQTADAGSVRLDGQDLLADPVAARRLLGYLPQEFGVYPQVTAEALLDQFAVFKGFADARERRALVRDHLRLVNLDQHRHQKLGTFSGGMRQRFGIAQALIGSPRLLIIDEPTAGLDPAERIRLQTLLSELSADRVVLLSTHIVEDVAALCPAIAVIDRGAVRRTGAPEALVAELRNRVWSRVVRDAADIPAGARLITARTARGVRQVRVLADDRPGADFEAVEPELDDVYFTALLGA